MMDSDFIKISKSDLGTLFTLEIYFCEINSTIKIELSESSFLRFVLTSANLYNENTTSYKISFSQDELTDLIARKQIEQLRNISQEFRMLNHKPEADVFIFIPDAYVPLNHAEILTNACGDFMEAMGFELETEDEPVFGSFFKKLKYVFSSTIGDEDLTSLYEKGRKALELKYVELPTAEQTDKLASAAEKLVKSLEGVEEGVIRCGALIVLKKVVNGKTKLIIQQLSTELIILLDKRPQLLFNVNTIYELITGDVRTDIDEGDAEQIKIA